MNHPHIVLSCLVASLALTPLQVSSQTASLQANRPAQPEITTKTLVKSADMQTKADAKLMDEPTENKRKATRDEILGTYIYDEFRLTASFQGWDYMYCIPELVAGEEPDEVILNGFWADYDESYQPPRPISQVKATFDYENQTISIPAGASLGTFGEYPAYIYVSEWDTDILQDEPIVLKVDAETRNISYWCERPYNDWTRVEKCLIVTSYPDAVGKKIAKGVDFIGAIEMNKYNGIMSISNISSSSAGYVPVYTEVSGTNAKVYNFGGYGYTTALEFSIDVASRTATAPVTLCTANAQIDSETTADLYFASPTGGDITAKVSAAGQDALYTVSIGEWCLYDVAGQRAIVEFDSASFNVDLGIAGIDHIKGDTAPSAPQYFNLQGIRLSHPTPGSVIIKVDGNKASKVFINQ
ncbi:MAG: hypothetical protein NC189_02975 [Bacteroides sp.]|nr:hypothetical protein [Bacteroides sp.]MCM1476309.1 hypothetical protein [Bacteroides sp.]